MSRLRRMALRLAAPAAALGLLGCGTAAPPPTIYVLGSPADSVEKTEPLTGRPVVEVKPVLVPDYLDVSEILVRRADNVVAPSPTGRWGERLSIGMTRALVLGLTRRLPDFVVTATDAAAEPAQEVLVDVETFGARAEGSVVLVARWRVLDGRKRSLLAGERVSLTQPVQGTGDAAIVAAMSRAVEELAARIAEGIERTTATKRRSR